MISTDKPAPMDPSERIASEAMAHLPPAAPIDPAFSRRVLRSARAEIEGSNTSVRRTERFFTRVLVPLSLIVCAAGWSYHVAHVAEHVYLSHAR